MRREEGIRKRVKHGEYSCYARELTFSCFEMRPLLRDERRCEIVARAIGAATERHRHRLLAYVLMPNHVHLVVAQSGESSSISSLLYAIKRPSSARIKQLIAASDPRLLASLTVRERPTRTVFRFWQEGSGYDRAILTRDVAKKSIEYSHANPVRAGLCGSPAAWRWSSAAQWEGGDGEPVIDRASVSR